MDSHAFPQSAHPLIDKNGFAIKGLTKLEYFAARAPATIMWDFDVKMPELRPMPEFDEPLPAPKYGDAPVKELSDIIKKKKNEKKFLNDEAIKKWDNEFIKQQTVQWPIVWAKAILKTLEGAK